MKHSFSDPLMRAARVGVAIGVVVSLTSCSSLRPVVTKRYHAALLQGAPSAPTFSIFAMAVPPSPAAPLVLSLAERGQAALITQIGAHASGKELLQALQGDKKDSPNLDLTVVERRIVLSLENRSPMPADRIDRAAVTVTLGTSDHPPTARFRSWDQFSTKYQTVNLGSVKVDQSQETTFGLKLTPPQIKEIAEATAGSKSTRAMEELLSLQQRYVEATGTLSPLAARILQQGAPGIDLTGNVTVDVTLELGDPDQVASLELVSFAKLFDDGGKPNPADTVVVQPLALTFLRPSACAPVTADASVDTTVRTVLAGAATFMEGDDDVAYVEQTVKSPAFLLVPKAALQASAWAFVDAAGNQVQIVSPTGTETGALLLPSFDEAVSLQQYLVKVASAAPVKLGGWGLQLAGHAVTKTDVPNVSVEIQKLNWKTGGCA